MIFQTWLLHLWHQCFSDMTSTLMTSVYFIHDIYIHYSWCFSDMTSIFITSVFLRHDIYIMASVFFRHEIYIYDISIFYMKSTLMTSVFFRHDIYIDDISVFHMISNENHFIYRWMTKNLFNNRTVTFLQLYKKLWQYHNWSFGLFVLLNSKKRPYMYYLFVTYPE